MSQLISKTDLLVDNTFYETLLEQQTWGDYTILQSTNGVPPLNEGVETVVMDKEQAISIAKSILRNEGITNV